MRPDPSAAARSVPATSAVPEVTWMFIPPPVAGCTISDLESRTPGVPRWSITALNMSA